MIYAFLGVGFALLWFGSEAVRRGGVGLFRTLGLPPTFLALLFASLAMCAPELSVTIQAASRGMSDIALGDVVGSTIANILLVFGCGALLHPMPGPPRIVFRDGGALILAALAFVFMLLAGPIGTAAGVILLAGWIAYLVLVFITDLGRPPLLPADHPLFAGGTDNNDNNGSFGAFLFVIAIVCLFFGARLVIDFARLMARDFHQSQIAVALTIVAFATSLPELAAIVGSAARGHSTIIAGHVLASSIFNILLVVGVAALVHPLSAAPVLSELDAPVLAFCALALPVLMLFGWRLTRIQGALLLIGYIAYIGGIGLRSGLRFLG